MKKRVKNKLIIICTIMILFICVVAPLGISIMIYGDSFGSRYETISWMQRSMDEFNGLNAQRHTFKSNNGQQLVGYIYSKDIIDSKGIVIISHGLGGGGHNSYMDVADYFATKGYLTFAYDATGNDESEGDSVQGIPQGGIDLDYAIRYIKSQAEFSNLPIMLFGHSWGAYSVGSVLNIHPDINAVVMVAGFNKSMDIIEEEGRRMAGDAMNLFVPYLSFIERIKFGSYSKYTCVDGFDNSSAGVMIIHSADDKMVSYENQYQMFDNKYSEIPRFKFIPYVDRGHDFIYYTDESNQYKDALNKDLKEYSSSLDGELTAKIKTEYMNDHLDKSQLFELDTELFEQIITFYDAFLVK